MNANIELNCGVWYIGNYCIVGNVEDGYSVYNNGYEEETAETEYSGDFESCLVWCMNS